VQVISVFAGMFVVIDHLMIIILFYFYNQIYLTKVYTVLAHKG
jgi:hypothetical protein